MSLDPKDPDVATTYSINWIEALVDEALRGADFALNAIVRPQRVTGFYYEATTAGKTKAHYPVWPIVAGATVLDGSVIWTARHPADVTVPTVSSALWTVPAGITKDSQSETATHTHITLSGGTAGEDYLLTCRMTPSSGNPEERSITVPVRHL